MECDMDYCSLYTKPQLKRTQNRRVKLLQSDPFKTHRDDAELASRLCHMRTFPTSYGISETFSGV